MQRADLVYSVSASAHASAWAKQIRMTSRRMSPPPSPDAPAFQPFGSLTGGLSEPIIRLAGSPEPPFGFGRALPSRRLPRGQVPPLAHGVLGAERGFPPSFTPGYPESHAFAEFSDRLGGGPDTAGGARRDAARGRSLSRALGLST